MRHQTIGNCPTFYVQNEFLFSNPDSSVFCRSAAVPPNTCWIVQGGYSSALRYAGPGQSFSLRDRLCLLEPAARSFVVAWWVLLWLPTLLAEARAAPNGKQSNLVALTPTYGVLPFHNPEGTFLRQRIGVGCVPSTIDRIWRWPGLSDFHHAQLHHYETP